MNRKMKLFITEGAANGAKNRVSYRHVRGIMPRERISKCQLLHGEKSKSQKVLLKNT